MRLCIVNRLIVAASMSLRWGDVKFVGLQLFAYHWLVNGKSYSRVGDTGRCGLHWSGVRKLKHDGAVSALLPTEVNVGAPVLPSVSYGCMRAGSSSPFGPITRSQPSP